MVLEVNYSSSPPVVSKDSTTVASDVETVLLVISLWNLPAFSEFSGFCVSFFEVILPQVKYVVKQRTLELI